MTSDQQADLSRLDKAEREGCVLTGAERGRLADLRRAEILEAVQSLLPAKSPTLSKRETR